MTIIKKIRVMLLFCVIFSIAAWEILYFSFGEGFVLGLSGYLSVLFLFGWYRKTTRITQFFNQGRLRLYFYLLPSIPVILYLVILNTAASWDVVGDFFYGLMYLLLGIAWLSLSLNGMLLFWSFSYEDDVLMGKNNAALITLTGAIIGSSLIYAAANVGDGPGWWTVVIAGGIGTLTWLLLGLLINKLTAIIEAITMEHDVNSGIRFGSYLIASGLILALASSGDWTSFSVTLSEFLVGWPVLPLTGIVVILEGSLFKIEDTGEERQSQQFASIIVTLCYLLYAALVVFMLMSPLLGGSE